MYNINIQYTTYVYVIYANARLLLLDFAPVKVNLSLHFWNNNFKYRYYKIMSISGM